MSYCSRKIEEIIYRLRRNYPLYPSTFALCQELGCSASARGGGSCANCCEKILAELCEDAVTAKSFHEATKKTCRLQGVLMRVDEND